MRYWFSVLPGFLLATWPSASEAARTVQRRTTGVTAQASLRWRSTPFRPSRVRSPRCQLTLDVLEVHAPSPADGLPVLAVVGSRAVDPVHGMVFRDALRSERW